MKNRMKQVVTLLMTLIMVISISTNAFAEVQELGAEARVTERIKWEVYAATPYSSGAKTVSFTCTAVRTGKIQCTELTGANEITIKGGYVAGTIKSLTGAGQYRYFEIPNSYVGMTVSFVMGIKAEEKPASAKGWLDY